MGERSDLIAEDAPYVPFIVLSGARTGSTLLTQALNSHPDIICFGEIFNYVVPVIDYRVDGYDKASRADIELRDADPQRFLRERIYCKHPNNIRAVGFKFHYLHFWGHEGLWETLAQETGIPVIHLQRRNWLRMCVSERVARQTGVWEDVTASPSQRAATLTRKLTPAKALSAIRNPAGAAASLKRTLAPPAPRKKAEREPVTITKEELDHFFLEASNMTSHFPELFEDHRTLDVTYEEMAADPDHTFAEVQQFLGVTLRKLTISNRKQNPEPLSELIANYDELRSAFRDHENAWMFDD